MGPGPSRDTARVTNEERDGAAMTTRRLLSDRYELGETLGYGGMSEVHRGRAARQRDPTDDLGAERKGALGRIGQPDDTAKVAVFLASDDSGWVTGETLLVSGGNY